jgi:hypothetical protein
MTPDDWVVVITVVVLAAIVVLAIVMDLQNPNSAVSKIRDGFKNL